MKREICEEIAGAKEYRMRDENFLKLLRWKKSIISLGKFLPSLLVTSSWKEFALFNLRFALILHLAFPAIVFVEWENVAAIFQFSIYFAYSTIVLCIKLKGKKMEWNYTSRRFRFFRWIEFENFSSDNFLVNFVYLE